MLSRIRIKLQIQNILLILWPQYNNINDFCWLCIVLCQWAVNSWGSILYIKDVDILGYLGPIGMVVFTLVDNVTMNNCQTTFFAGVTTYCSKWLWGPWPSKAVTILDLECVLRSQYKVPSWWLPGVNYRYPFSTSTSYKVFQTP